MDIQIKKWGKQPGLKNTTENSRTLKYKREFNDRTSGKRWNYYLKSKGFNTGRFTFTDNT